MVDLTDEEKAIYEWQLWVPGFGEEGQRKLKAARALVTRVGGLGGPAAQQLAAAGLGKIVLAHAGNLKPSDLNRQILMTDDWLGKPRVESAARRIKDLNPRMQVEPINANVSEDNVADLVSRVDIVFDCTPLFRERFLLNRECVRQNKPMVECAMYNLEGQVTLILPGRTPCLACLYPEEPPAWKREFPVFGAVSALAACIGVMEGIKWIAGMKLSLAGTMLFYDTQNMNFRKVALRRVKDCPVCGHL